MQLMLAKFRQLLRKNSGDRPSGEMREASCKPTMFLSTLTGGCALLKHPGPNHAPLSLRLTRCFNFQACRNWNLATVEN